MVIRYPRPLVAGDVVAVTSPSSGVPGSLRARFDVAVERVRAAGYVVEVGAVMGGSGVASAPAEARARELEALLTDPRVRAVVPPWGGELAIDLLEHLHWDALAADPTWFVGFSDISTLLLALTLRTGVATLHGQNLMDTPYRVPEPMGSWLDVVRMPEGAVLTQGAALAYRAEGFDDWESDPTVDEWTLDTPGGWVRLDATGDVEVTGRLVGGCLETVSHLAGTPYGDVPGFAGRHAPEGLVVYLESVGSDAADMARRLVGLRYAGWFDAANAVLLARTRGPAVEGFTPHDAARHALGDLGVPVIADVECGHVPPHLALVNGALARVLHSSDRSVVEQRLV